MVDHIENLYNKVKTYTETSIEIYKLQAINTSADVISTLAHKAILILVISTFIVFFNVAMALLLGDVLGSTYKGFLVISLFYLIVGFILFVFSSSIIKNPVSNLIISKMIDTRTKQQKVSEIIEAAKKIDDEK